MINLGSKSSFAETSPNWCSAVLKEQTVALFLDSNYFATKFSWFQGKHNLIQSLTSCEMWLPDGPWLSWSTSPGHSPVGQQSFWNTQNCPQDWFWLSQWDNCFWDSGCYSTRKTIWGHFSILRSRNAHVGAKKFIICLTSSTKISLIHYFCHSFFFFSFFFFNEAKQSTILRGPQCQREELSFALGLAKC